MHKTIVFFRNLRFKYKLIISYIIVIIIPLVSLGFYSLHQAETYLLKQTEMTLNDNVKKAADDINYKFNKYNTIMESISYNTRIINILNMSDDSLYSLYQQLTDVYDPLFDDLKSFNEDINQIMVYTSNPLTERANSIQSLERLKDKSWFQALLKSDHTQWNYEQGTLFGMRRMANRYGSPFIHVLYMDINRDQVFGVLGLSESRNHGVVITDQEGNDIYSKLVSNKNQATGSVMESEPFEYESTRNGSDYLAVAKPISEPGWTITYYYPLEELTIHTGKIIEATAVIAGICFVILLLLILVFSHSFVRRIEYLNKKVNLIAQGDLQIKISDKSRDEIGKLTTGIDQMLNNINMLIDEVKTSNRQQRHAEMRALQAQINPHFLYNSLSLINWLAIKMKARDISLITTSLSRFYRTTLNKGSNIITIKEEIINVKSYLDIQVMKHDHSFDLYMDIEESLFELSMVNMTLQPIVENAIEHGLDHKTEGRGCLRLSGTIKDEIIVFEIEDNGPGMELSQAERLWDKHSDGFGLKNVQERLELYYGKPFGISVHSKPGRGTLVRVSMPKQVRNAD
ncbi:sensor histidine kinase [Paenibacillus silvisoli]|uniref:sensor histidine kinase n=1 Tax=Paenibacillus silvisoli TaxID=3110539 RepID=UPI002803A807|nr:histidine kinase [Paenibacillus silvisoli]